MKIVINIYQLLTILGASFCILFLMQFVQLDKLRLKKRLYLYFVIIFSFYLFLYELLISFEMWEFAEYGVFLYYPLLFVIYPLFYLYTRQLLIPSTGLSFNVWRFHSVIPLLVFILTIIIYNILPVTTRKSILFLSYALNFQTPIILFFQVTLFIFYYAQFFVYFFLMIKLASLSKNLFEEKNYFAKWIYAFLTAAFLYEGLLVFSTIFVPGENYLALEQSFSLAFVLFAGFIGFNQWLIQLKIKIENFSSPKGNNELNKNSHNLLTSNAKQEIKNEIEKFIKEKKIFKDPQLKIESFAKRMHIPLKKLSKVINELYGTNFHGFINSLRIEEAKSIILRSPVKSSVEDIFLEVGFLSRSTFNRAFKSNTGITPREFQAKFHKSA